MLLNCLLVKLIPKTDYAIMHNHSSPFSFYTWLSYVQYIIPTYSYCMVLTSGHSQGYSRSVVPFSKASAVCEGLA